MYLQKEDDWDLKIYNRSRELVLIVQTKSKLNVSSEWAAKFRRNMLAHGIFPTAPYFLMVFPDKLYLWTSEDEQLNEREADYSVDARPIFQPYFEKAGVVAERISSQSLELIVSSWLAKIMYLEEPFNKGDESEQWLFSSGLYDAIAGGSFAREAVA